MAEAVQFEVLHSTHSNNLLRACQRLGLIGNLVPTTEQSISILMTAYSLVSGPLPAKPEVQESAPQPLPPVGEHKVSLQSTNTLRGWWTTWVKGDRQY